MQVILVAILVFCGTLIGLKITFPYLAPLYLGLVVSLVIDAPVTFLEKFGFSRALATLLFTCLSLVGLPVILLIFGVQLWQEIQQLLIAHQWPDFFSEQVIQLLERFPIFVTQLSPVNMAVLIRTVYRWTVFIPDLLLIWLLTNFCAYFFCKDKRLLSQRLNQLLPKGWRTNFFQAYRKTYGALWDLFKVQLVLLVVSSLISVIIFVLLDVSYAVLLGILAGFVDFLPVVGPGVIYLILAINQILLGKLPAALILGLAYLIILLIRQLGEPRLVGGQLELHPLLAVIGLYAGFRLWGLLGALVAPVLLVIIRSFLHIYTANE